MAGSSFGQLFRVTTFGESHGECVGVVIDGCPAGLALELDFIQSEMRRRKPGQSRLVSQRHESDEARFISGVFEGTTTGAPLTAVIVNEDQRSKDYDHLRDVFRPSHADFTWQQKYGHRDHRGGGRAAARETAARVLAGAVAKLFLRPSGVSIRAYVSQVGDLQLTRTELDLDECEKNPVRCPDPALAERMAALIQSVRKEGDTIGGVVSCVVRGCVAGWGEPVFDKLHADLGKAMLGIPAAKGFEIGSGFAGVRMRGSQHNDLFLPAEAGALPRTATNFSGGIQGGISNGMDIELRVAFKPVATLLRPQPTVDASFAPSVVEGRGRHDPCVVPRAVPVVEAMAALVLADHALRARAARVAP